MAKIKTKATRKIPRNLSLQLWYREQLFCETKKMADDFEKELLKIWQVPKLLELDPKTAKDASPTKDITELVKHMRFKWGVQFNEFANEVARKFTGKASKSATRSLRNILKESGWTVDFKLSRALMQVLQATVAENVSLIKSIHGVYFTQVETIVMQGVKNGRDLGFITKELQDRYAITQRKAVIIARDQTNKAMESISRTRTLETGLTKAIWVHISGKKSSRETHERFNKKEFDLREGLYDSAVKMNVFPGDLINCNCTYRIVIPDVE